MNTKKYLKIAAAAAGAGVIMNALAGGEAAAQTIILEQDFHRKLEEALKAYTECESVTQGRFSQPHYANSVIREKKFVFNDNEDFTILAAYGSGSTENQAIFRANEVFLAQIVTNGLSSKELYGELNSEDKKELLEKWDDYIKDDSNGTYDQYMEKCGDEYRIYMYVMLAKNAHYEQIWTFLRYASVQEMIHTSK